MDPFDLTQSFIECCQRAAPSELSTAFQSATEQLGFRHFACCSHVNPKRPPQNAVVLHNYPKIWVSNYADRNLHECDPVFLRAERDMLPFHWDEPGFRVALTAPQRRLLREAASFGLVHGYTVPIHLPWMAGALRASCSVVPDSRSIEARAYHAVQVMAMHLYASVGYQKNLRAARNAALLDGPILSARERQCLGLAAEGKSDWAISQILSISEHTVHKHIEAAKRRLGVATRVQAIVWAAQHCEISVGDVVKAHPVGSGTVSARNGGARLQNTPRQVRRSSPCQLA